MQRQSIQNWRVSSLEWAAGFYCLLIGAMMLVDPNHININLWGRDTNSTLVWWGGMMLLAAFVIFGVSVFPPPHWTLLGAHIFTSGLMLTLAIGFFQINSWLSGANLLLLSLGLMVGGVFRVSQGTTQLQRPADLFGLVIGLAGIVNGLVFLFGPEHSPTVVAAFEESQHLVMGLANLASGILLVAYQVYAAALSKQHLRLPGALFNILAYGMLGLVYLVAAGVTLLDNAWASWALFGSFALVLLATPIVYRRMHRLTPTLLWPRVALGLTMVMALPLITTVAVVHQQERRSVLDEALQRQQSMAVVLALDVQDTLELHEAALTALASDPELLRLPHQQQQALLANYQKSYPNVLAFALFDVEGNLLARSDPSGSTLGVKNYPVYEEAKATGMPSLDVLISPVFHRPVFTIGAPIFNSQGQFNGLLSLAMSSDDIVSLLDTGGSGADYHAYMVDGNGRVIAHPDETLVLQQANLAGSQPVARSLSSGQPVGNIEFASSTGPRLAGYARVPGFSWVVVLERTESDALQAVNAGSSLAYIILLLGMALTGIGGAMIGRWVAKPLGVLSGAALELARGNDRVPLPSSQITELDHLARAFGEMRDRLALRTREREQAEEALRRVNEALELRVSARTDELRAANERLQIELAVVERLMAQLDDERARLNSLFENAPTGILVIDETGRLVLTNRVADGFFGRDWLYQGNREQWRSLNMRDPQGRPCPPEDLPLARSLAREEFVQSQELLFEREGQPLLSLLCNAAPIFDTQKKLVGAMMIFQDITEHKRTADDLRRRAAQIEVQRLIIQHREDERISIARDLHDGPLQELIGASFSINEAASVLRDDDARALIDNVQRGLQRQIQEMRTFLSELRPPALAPFGLERAIRSHHDSFSRKHSDLDLTLDLDRDGQLLPEPIRLALYRIYQEGLNNVVRHAKASRVSVRLRLNEETIALTIEDNGCGFEVPAEWVGLARNGHLGLVGMRERAEALGGSLSLRSDPGTGTTLSVSVPRDRESNV